MPSPRILRVLNMTPAQWGALPPEIGSHVGAGIQCSTERTELKQKALRILAEEDKKAAELGGGGAFAGSVAEDINRRFDALETRMGAMERGYAALEKSLNQTPRERDEEKHGKNS